MSSLDFFLIVLRIFAYSILCLSSPLSTISCRFVIRAPVGDDIFDFNGLLIALVILDALCCIMYEMVSLMVSMAFSTCIVRNRFLHSSWNSIYSIMAFLILLFF